MKAIVYREYGPPHEVLRLKEIVMPVPKDDEVLIRVHAASVNPLDVHVMTTVIGRLMGGLRRPRQPVPGVDASGVVEAVGKKVTRFAPGDAVFGSCDGAFAEYACAKVQKIALKPLSVTHEQAASLPVAGLTALQALRDAGKISKGQTVLINGASGGVGTFAVQIAAHYGADITAVCSTRNVEMVRSLGTNSVIDYTLEDFTRTGETYDIIFDLVGDRPISDYRRALVPNGTYVGAGMLGKEISIPGVVGGMIGALVLKPFISHKLILFMAKVDTDDLAALAQLVAVGAIDPVIDRTFDLTQAPDAIQYVRDKHAKGKVVISIIGTPPSPGELSF